MDRDGLLMEGQTTNDKIKADVRSYLNLHGIDGDEVDIYIGEADDHTVEFDLDDPDNNLRYFQLRIDVPSSVMAGGVCGCNQPSASAKVFFRNARAAIVQ